MVMFSCQLHQWLRKKLQMLQNRGLRCALNKGLETSRDQLHEEGDLQNLNLRREQHLLNLMIDWSRDPKFLNKTNNASVQTRLHTKKLLKVRRPRTEKFVINL